jgi:hypothetical protein
MKNGISRKAYPAVLAVILAAAAAVEGAPDGGAAARKPSVLILNLKSGFDDGLVGMQVGYSLRSKLRRSELFDMPEELDISEAEASGAERPGLEDLHLVRELAGQFEAQVVVWGEVFKRDGFEVRVRVINLAVDASVKDISRSAPDQRQLSLACRDLADDVARAITGQGYREDYASMSAESFRRVGPNLVVNGDFEKGTSAPEGWEAPDGLTSFWDKDPKRGRIIRFDTDVYLSEWKAWREKLAAGAAVSEAPQKTKTSGNRYDTIAGSYGVRLYSEAIPVKPGATYAIELDARGRMGGDFFFAKVFVKGYGAEGPTKEHYNMYEAVRVSMPDQWDHFSRVFHPTARTPEVTTMRVMLFAYWPPAKYAFDNIAVYEVTPGGA